MKAIKIPFDLISYKLVENKDVNEISIHINSEINFHLYAYFYIRVLNNPQGSQNRLWYFLAIFLI